MFPIGNIYETRKKLDVTQENLALASGTGLRFIIELEKGKKTCQIGKVLTALHTLGIKLTLTPPKAREGSRDGARVYHHNDLVGNWRRTTAGTCLSNTLRRGCRFESVVRPQRPASARDR